MTMARRVAVGSRVGATLPTALLFAGQAWKIVELSSNIEEMTPVVRSAAKKRKAEAELEAQTLLKKQKSSSSKDHPQESAMDLTE